MRSVRIHVLLMAIIDEFDSAGILHVYFAQNQPLGDTSPSYSP